VNGKPLHYDGSNNDFLSNGEEVASEPFLLTDEMRKSIGVNPFEIHIEE
jgi:hypothetical protein